MPADSRLIVALDLPTRAAADAMVETLGDAVSFYKIGLQLLTGGGMDMAADLKARGRRVFLDCEHFFDGYGHDPDYGVSLLTEAFEAGACGYLLKTVSAVELVGAVSAAAAGATVTDERISKRLMERWRSKRPLVERLTPRETDVLRLLVKGSSNKEIAATLGVGGLLP